jgi:hypothetical protein
MSALVSHHLIKNIYAISERDGQMVGVMVRLMAKSLLAS